MIPAPFRVVLDACVLFPYTLRDTLLRAAAGGFYQLYWSEQILEEARRNLVTRHMITSEQSERLVATMKTAFPEAMVTGYEPLIASEERRKGSPCRCRRDQERRASDRHEQFERL